MKKDYYIRGNADKEKEIKGAFKAKGIDTTGVSMYNDSYIFYSSNGLLKFEKFSDNLLNIFKSHPNYQELELPVNSKFKVGDWIVQNDNGIVSQITNIINGKDEYGEYIAYEHTNGYFAACFENEFHLWSIEDAKDGDVITNGKLIVIFNKLEEPAYRQHIIAYVGLDLCGRLQITEDTWQLGVDKAMPANKEQCNLLFKKIKEAGYQWNVDTKELRKTIEPKFKVGDWVVSNGQPAIIYELKQNYYLGKYLNGHDFCHKYADEDKLHLWTIKDAKDGDVLVSGIDNPFIYNGNIEFSFAGAYVGISRDGRIRLNMFPSKSWTSIKDVKPATKEQRDIMFDKIKEIDYEWDEKNKELRRIIEPKFKVGDWIVNGGANPCYVKSILGDYYELCSCEGFDYTKHIIDVDYIYHLWSIEDAKNGDVLVTIHNSIFIYNGKRNQNKNLLGAYGGMINLHFEKAHTDDCWTEIVGVKPATKEQCEMLFDNMKIIGYEWNCEKKELHKIITSIEPKFKVGDVIKKDNTIETIAEINVDNYFKLYYCESGRTISFENQDLWDLAPKPHYDISNFEPFDHVLVRNHNGEPWVISHFSDYFKDYCRPFICENKESWAQCIPFNNDTKHLRGTNKMCDKCYINW